jgi:flagellar FliL protein
MSAAATTADAEAPAKPKSKKLLFIIIGVVVLALIGAGAALFLLKKNTSDEEGDGTQAEEEAQAPAPPKIDPKAPPTFLPLDSMVVNLADPGGNRFAQLSITLQVADPKTADDLKIYMPSIRNGILILVSQRTAEDMLRIEGKETLAQDIIGEISNVMGYDYEDPNAEPPADTKGKKPRRKRAVYNPITGVLFSSFIVQ